MDTYWRACILNFHNVCTYTLTRGLLDCRLPAPTSRSDPCCSCSSLSRACSTLFATSSTSSVRAYSHVYVCFWFVHVASNLCTHKENRYHSTQSEFSKAVNLQVLRVCSSSNMCCASHVYICSAFSRVWWMHDQFFMHTVL
jgi:hypothetical protein